MQLFSLLMNASLCITASCHASLPWCDVIVKSYYRFNIKQAGAMRFTFCMPGLGQGSGPGMFRTCLPVGRYKENKKILLILLILSKNIPPQAANFK
jgi:hypothetical protein